MLIQLSEYDEMRNICNYIFNKFDDDKIIIKILNSVLNCSFIKNLSEFCYNREEGKFSFKIIEEVFEYLDGLIYRNIKKNEIQYFIFNYSIKYKPNFKITFPKFTGMDLIYLFIDINNNCDVVKSFLLGDVSEIKLTLYNLESLINIGANLDDNSDFIDYLDLIVKTIFKRFNKENKNKLNLVKEILKKEENIKIKNLCKIIINLYEKEELKILRKDFIFNIEDIYIYKYIEDKNIIGSARFSRFPSLIFFMLNYKFDIEKLFLDDDNKNFGDKNEFMPFWLFSLRYFSSIECLKSKEVNYFSEIIDKNIRNHFKTSLKERLISHNWLNFICLNNKSISYEPLYEKIKLFFYKLSEDDYFLNLNVESYIDKEINNAIFYLMVQLSLLIISFF